jgi:hypothetical protein
MEEPGDALAENDGSPIKYLCLLLKPRPGQGGKARQLQVPGIGSDGLFLHSKYLRACKPSMVTHTCNPREGN